MGLSPLFGFGISPDDKNVTKQMAQFSQGGLGMPDRDYYLKTDARTEKIRAAYLDYMAKMFKLMNDEDPTKSTQAVMGLESKLANASMTRVERRDPYKTYNKYAVTDLDKQQPGMAWKQL